MNRSILVVDDDLGIQESLVAILELEGYEVIVANNGLEALTQLSATAPALIVLDWMMPHMDGLTFVRELEQRQLRDAFRILILTADGHAPEKALQAGAEAYLHKPFDIDELLNQVSRMVSE